MPHGELAWPLCGTPEAGRRAGRVRPDFGAKATLLRRHWSRHRFRAWRLGLLQSASTLGTAFSRAAAGPDPGRKVLYSIGVSSVVCPLGAYDGSWPARDLRHCHVIRPIEVVRLEVCLLAARRTA